MQTFTAKINRQRHSITIPTVLMKKLNLHEGDILTVRISKAKKVKDGA